MVDPFTEFVGTFHHERRQNLIRYMLAFDATPKGKKEIVCLLNKHGMARSEAWKALLEAEEYLRHHRFVPLDVKTNPLALRMSDLTGDVTKEIQDAERKFFSSLMIPPEFFKGS